MKKQPLPLLIAVFLVSVFAIFYGGSTGAAPQTGVSYTRDVRPILEGRCGKCHSGEFVSASLNMETYDSLLAGSENGPVIRPGDAGGSLLVEMLVSGKMPERGPRLTPAQIRLIKDWIEAGALNN